MSVSTRAIGRERRAPVEDACVLDGQGNVLATGRRISIGSAEDNDVRLADPTVSRWHVELEVFDDGVRVRDLGSRNGTYVGEVRVESAVLSRAGTVRIGRTTIRVELRTSDASADEGVPVIPALVGDSPAMKQVRTVVGRLGPTQVSVLVQGETGTGKELVARALHDLSPRRNKPFVIVDCGSLPATLVASELFGHERGSFTGAERQHLGAFERARGGTIFLDEIGDLPPSVQPALLGVLERKTFRRVGGSADLASDVRLISATHHDIRSDANENRFRSDLFFRIGAARIVLPPLRERLEDLGPLARHFAREIIGDAADHAFADEALAALAGHRFSGNVRELRNIVEVSVAMGAVSAPGQAEDRISSPPADARGQPEPTRAQAEEATAELAPYARARAEALESFEARYFRDLIERCAGNASRAARVAEMDRTWLLKLLRRHGLR